MNKFCFLFGVLLLLSANVLCDSVVLQRTPDGRFSTSCYMYGNEENCEVPFVRLLVTPERYDGKIIRVTGYLINIYGSPVLFANKSSFDSGANIEGIILKGVTFPKEMEKKINSGIWPIYIVGKFNARFDNDDKVSRLGMIEDVSVLRLVQ